MDDKTEQTLKALVEKCEQIKYGEWSVKLYIFKQQIVGFDQIGSPVIKFRAGGQPKRSNE